MRLPFPMASKVCLSAAVMGLGAIDLKLVNCSQYKDIWRDVPESKRIMRWPVPRLSPASRAL